MTFQRNPSTIYEKEKGYGVLKVEELSPCLQFFLSNGAFGQVLPREKAQNWEESGFCLHHIKTRGSYSQFHQTTGQFYETMVQLTDRPWHSRDVSNANTNNSQSQSVYPTQRAGWGAVTHLWFVNDSYGDCFHLVIKPLEIWISDWWTLSRCKGHTRAFKWNVTLKHALSHSPPREIVSVFFKSSEKAWELNPLWHYF